MAEPLIPEPIDGGAVAGIVALDDAVLRNLWITATYAELGRRFDEVLGGTDHTWCRFAVWASATAGASIRKEELPGVVTALLRRADHQRTLGAANDRLRNLRALRLVDGLDHGHIAGAVEGALDTVSARIAHGNTLVFAELAPRMFAFVTADPVRLEPTDVADVVGRDTDDDLLGAFEWYRRAAAATDERARAAAVLAANVLAVAHEQRRLQADITAAMDAGIIGAAEVARELLPHWTPARIVRAVARRIEGPIVRLLAQLWEEVTTELMMTLRVPGAVLRLRDPVPPGPDGHRFPMALRNLATEPAELAEATAVFAAWDRTGGTGRHDGARDWAVLRERMNYIVNLFRSRQQDTTLRRPPFDQEQLTAMRAGRVPPGPLLPPRHLAGTPAR